jgi:1,2-diacylglycerol 3-beta-glucosyltransferase
MWELLSILLLVILIFPLVYKLAMALASIQASPPWSEAGVKKYQQFIIAIAAHNEEDVIEKTVVQMKGLNYPSERFSVHLVADHCSDATAALARKAGAIVHERNVEPRSGKGAALSWLFEQIWQTHPEVDAIVIFDADTIVDKDFLRAMNARLEKGERVIQGQHIIVNPHQGWFPLLIWAMFIIDNRFQNLGRTNLGWSAKHMGDSICFRADVLRQMGWGMGLTEDYQLRQRMLLEGIRIQFEPAAKGYGEAPQSMTWAGRQRMRWLRGTHDANQQYAPTLVREGLKRGDLAMIDGALQAYLPSYSTLTLIAVLALVVQAAINLLSPLTFSAGLLEAWFVYTAILFFYPYLGLALEHAPMKAYLIILTGPAFIVWRSWLAIRSRYLVKQVAWTRTAHGVKPS